MKNKYKAGGQGGRTVIDFPENDNEGKPNKGRKFKRTVWADGRIVYKEVKE